MVKKLLYFVCCLFVLTSARAQSLKAFVDLRCSPTLKPFNSQARSYDVWEPIEHDCGASRSEEMVSTFGKNMSRKSQCNLSAMARGEVRVNCISLSPIQTQLLNGKLLNNDNKRETVSCLFGIFSNEIFLRLRDRFYFEDLVEQILYVQRFSEQYHDVDGTKFKYSVTANQPLLDAYLDDPQKVALVLTIDGGHALGHSIYIDGGVTETAEYEALLMDNIERLKGLKPLILNTDNILQVPVLYITLASPYENGIVGNCRNFNDLQSNILTINTAQEKGVTDLGRKVIKKLLERENSRRILIDAKGMSISGRDYFYKYLSRLEILGDATPVVFSSVGISGLSFTDPVYQANDNDAKNNGSYLNNWHRSLAKEDILAVMNFKGLVGISLDEEVLGGGKYFEALNKTLEGTKQRRELSTKLIVANMLRFVEVAGRKEAWDALCIGSNFDAMLNPSDVYGSSDKFPDLMNDLKSFFEKPTDIVGMYSVQQIKTLMFGLNAEEIVNKVMSLNAVRFLREQLGQGYVYVPPPSLKGNTEFRLKNYESAKVVCLAGSFNKWAPNNISCAKEGNDWVCRIDLAPGVYEYKFIVDNLWIVDPSNPEVKGDGNGNNNSVIKVK